MDFCDVVYRLRSHFFARDRDVTLQTSRSFYLGDGTQVSASCFVPIGGIIGWSGAIVDIPTNFALCDGNNGTPNLTDRFIIGAGNTYNVGDTGGAATIDIQHNHGGSTGNESAHTHGPGTLATDSDTHSHGPGTLATDNDTHDHDVDSGTTASDSHSHGPGTLATDSDSHSHDLEGGDSLGGPGTFGINTDSDSHSHDVDSGTTASDSHSHGPGTLNTDNDTHNHDVDSGVTATDQHSHDVDSGATAAGSAHSHTISNALSTTQSVLNPYYALAFIMRTA